MPDLADLVQIVVKRGASDLHISAQAPPVIRVNGSLERLNTPPLRPSDTRDLVFGILTQEQRQRLEAERELDLAWAVPGLARFRVNAYYQRAAVGAVLRLVPSIVKTVDDLRLPPALKEWATKTRGLVLVCGPTGSGKSTTLAAVVDQVNSTRPSHIMTVEDPIEFLHQHKRAIINQREVGTDTMSFSAALRSVLRQDPDVILVGELRDLETMSIALTAAETGHLVFATLHTQDAPQTIDRFIDVFPPHQQTQVRMMLAAAIQGVCVQQLIPTLQGSRAVVCEVMNPTPAVRNLIREGKTHQLYSVIQTGTQFGMQSMDAGLADLTRKGIISPAVALEHSNHPEDFKRLMGGAPMRAAS